MKGSRVTSGPSAAEQRKWQAEDDARTLARAGEIMGDRGRLARAKTVVKKQATDAAKAAKKIGKL
jgi:hypothetical protein